MRTDCLHTRLLDPDLSAEIYPQFIGGLFRLRKILHIDYFPDAKQVSNEKLLELSCDVLIPAALENQITASNAGRIKARVVLELANGPTSTEADDLLFKKGIHVVPDILANAGGVVVSTYEWEQNLKNEHWSEKEVLGKLQKLLEREAENVWQTSKKLKTDLRRAAFAVALERLEAALASQKANGMPR